MSEQLALLPGYLSGHLQLTVLALVSGIAVSLPTGIAAARTPVLERSALAVASVVQTIPSLALLALMVPILAALGTQSIGFLPAYIGLTLYSLLPVLRNTVTGICGVDPAVSEAARAVGMTPRQQLWKVEIPLALPVIVAGVRTSAVWVVGTATLSTPVGATSLGNYIFSGLQTRNLTAVLVGCVAAALLALGLDGVIRMLEVGLRKRQRALVAAAATLMALLVGGTTAHSAALALRGRADVVIGAKTFTEQYVLSEMLGQRLTAETGLVTDVRPSLGSTVAFDALRADDIDLYVDYSGTIWATVMHRETIGLDRQQVLRDVGQFLREEHDVTLVCALGFENTYALAMRRERAEALGIRTISELSVHTPELVVGGDYELFSRAEWTALVSSYGFEFREQRSMDPALMYAAAESGSVDVIGAYSTDGRIEASGLVVLEDDRAVIPPYDAIVLAGPELTREHPEALEALRGLEGSIAAAEMRRMNLAVDRDGESPAEVAARFLRREGRD